MAIEILSDCCLFMYLFPVFSSVGMKLSTLILCAQRYYKKFVFFVLHGCQICNSLTSIHASSPTKSLVSLVLLFLYEYLQCYKIQVSPKVHLKLGFWHFHFLFLVNVAFPEKILRWTLLLGIGLSNETKCLIVLILCREVLLQKTVPPVLFVKETQQYFFIKSLAFSSCLFAF